MKLFEAAKLICKVGGVPKPNITWFKNREEIPMEVTEELRIDEVDLKDRGIFNCTAENEVEVAPGVRELRNASSSSAVLNIESMLL